MLEDLIRQRVHFTRSSRTGFNHCVCEVCHDHSDRGGFKFSNGEIGYNCFNCGAGARYTEGSGMISRNFRKILNSFSISDDEIDNIVINKKFFETSGDTQGKVIKLNDIQPKQDKKHYLVTPEVALPKGCKYLGSTEEDLETQFEIVEYLFSRKIDPEAYPFMFSTDPKLRDYLIVPFFRNGKIIYWQGRSYKKNVSKKDRYNNCTEPKENVIFNMDELFRGSGPLFVSEGVFDAIPLNGIALIGSKIPEAKIEFLKKSKRDLIFIIDKDANGRSVAETALENGWKITFAPQFTEDVNNSIITHGSCWTIHQLFKNIPQSNFEAKTKIELYCGKKQWEKAKEHLRSGTFQT